MIAKQELEAIFGVNEKNIRFKDPAAYLNKKLSLLTNWNPDFAEMTEKFYKNAQKGVVKVIPMKTYQKHRYGTGINVDLLEPGELPEHRDIFTLNTPRFLRYGFIRQISKLDHS